MDEAQCRSVHNKNLRTVWDQYTQPQSERCRSVNNPPMMNQPFQCSVATLRNYGFFWGTNSPMTLMLTQVVYLFWNVIEIVGRALHAMNAWYRSKCNLFDDGSSPLFCGTIPAPYFLIASFKVPTCLVSAKLKIVAMNQSNDENDRNTHPVFGKVTYYLTFYFGKLPALLA